MRGRLWICIVLAVAACSGLTKVSAPDLTQPGDLQNAAGAQTAYVGALGSFDTELSSWAMRGGLFTDEFTSANGSFAPVDRRSLPDGGGAAAAFGGSHYFGPATRVNALIAIDLLERFNPAAKGQIGELFALLGTMETIMAEHLCAGVPLSTVVNDVPVAGRPLTVAQVYAHALAQFDSATRYATDSVAILQLAAVGRARALVDLDSLTAAAQAVAGVPTAFLYQAIYSTDLPVPSNVVSVQFLSPNISVSDREGGNGLDFVSAQDPRVPTDSVGLSNDGTRPLYVFGPQGVYEAPLPVASGIEARLIEAEAALAAGNAPGWTTDINALRVDEAETGVSGLPVLTSDSSLTASAALRLDVMFRERAFWLYASAHREGDLRRLMRQYGRSQDAVFPIGLYQHSGQSYGADITFPIVGENGNQNAPECVNRSP